MRHYRQNVRNTLSWIIIIAVPALIVAILGFLGEKEETIAVRDRTIAQLAVENRQAWEEARKQQEQAWEEARKQLEQAWE